MRTFLKSIGLVAGAVVALVTVAVTGAAASELVEPPILASSHGTLDLLMVARPAPVAALGPATTGWVFDVCPRPTNGALDCPPRPNRNLFGGVRLRLKARDSLKIHLVNKLPPVLDSRHATEPGHDFLALNPINIHTHGLLVSPRFPTTADPTYGDNVFVMTLNSANGPLPVDAHTHGDVRVDYTDYRIDIPAGHPSGLFWFHPHVHGIALNQVSAGLSGLITVGDLSDYVCDDAECRAFLGSLNVRHMILKDTQVLVDGTLMDQPDPGFCSPALNPGEADRQGRCPGLTAAQTGGADYAGGNWFFTVNGQTHPNVTVGANGEVWRLTNSSGSVSYDLGLNETMRNRDLIIQILAIDGVAVTLPPSIRPDAVLTLGGAKFKAVTCPPDIGGRVHAGKLSLPLCVSRLLMMPSSRVEIYVAYRDASGRLATPPPGSLVQFKTYGRQTGPTGDSWPTVNIASVDFSHYTGGDNGWQTLPGTHNNANSAMMGVNLYADNHRVGTVAGCTALAPGHRRRVFFNVPADNPSGFGLGYEEVDSAGQPVPGSFMDVTPFDPDTPTICLPLGRNNGPANETWELINLAGEDHNFHLHQVKFSVLGADQVTGAQLPTGSILHDNVPLPHALGTCDSVATWRSGGCTAYPIKVQIPFTVAGDFVYHCHILEHEDGGMMARIRVRPSY